MNRKFSSTPDFSLLYKLFEEYNKLKQKYKNEKMLLVSTEYYSFYTEVKKLFNDYLKLKTKEYGGNKNVFLSSEEYRVFFYEYGKDINSFLKKKKPLIDKRVDIVEENGKFFIKTNTGYLANSDIMFSSGSVIKFSNKKDAIDFAEKNGFIVV